MPGVDFDKLRGQISIEQVLDLLGFRPSARRGDQWYGPCPLHDSTRNRQRCFSVNVALGRYYCHACHSRGHQLDLWSAATRLPLYQAAIDLCRALAVDVPWTHRR
jgi:DNA primase